jgi:PAS domain S-box-containing protein
VSTKITYKKGNNPKAAKDFWSYLPHFRFGIFKKFLGAFLVISLIPIIIFTAYTTITIKSLRNNIVDHVKKTFDKKTQETMEMQATVAAQAVQRFLQQRVNDLEYFEKLKPDSIDYKQFYNQHKSPIWIRTGTDDKPFQEKLTIPIYKELAYIDRFGNEKIKIKDGKVFSLAQLKNVSIPSNTTYLSEKYFVKTINLKPGDIYVSHLKGFYVSEPEQLNGEKSIQNAVTGKKYDGVIRFAEQVYRKGKLLGIVMLAVDHRHLMEFTQHILPNVKEQTVFPVYSSGNYAFMFSDDGWIITHPKLWDIPGVDKYGKPVPPYTSSTPQKIIKEGRIPFNLDSAAFIHPAYPFVVKEIRLKKTGTVVTKNVGGIRKVMSYAPIIFNKGVYKKHGVFGGVTIGAEIGTFRGSALAIGNDMNNTLIIFRNNIIWLIIITALFAALASWIVSRQFTKPILKITDGARKLAEGKLSPPIEIDLKDEVGELAGSFNYMATELRKKNEQLMFSFDDLQQSKEEIEIYAGDLEYQLKIFRSIQKISNLLGTTFDINAMLKYILKNCVESVGFDRAILYLIDDNSKYLECREVYGFTDEEEKFARKSKYDITRYDCIETKVVNEGKIIFVQNFDSYEGKTNLDIKIRKIAKSKSFVFVPLQAKEKVIGILGADRLRSQTRISELDINSLQILANQASRVIENARLVNEIMTEKNFNDDILRYMLNGVITTNEKGIITSINQAAINILEIDSEDLIGKSVSEVFEKNGSTVNEIENAINRKGFYRGYDIKINLKNKFKYLAINVSLISISSERSSGVIIIIQDTTEKRAIDEQLQRMDRLASLGKFAAGIAHEIRNPLTGISLFLDDLHDNICTDKEVSSVIELALKEVERLENLVNELLDYAAPYKGELQERDINRLIENTILFVDKQCRQLGIQLTTVLDPSIPKIKIDGEKIRQALLNIIINSIQFMPGGGKLNIKTEIIPLKDNGQKNEKIKISISDTGPGIPVSDFKKIFDPFYTKRKGGTGLGLSLTHSIIAEHKGIINATSSDEGGAKFIIELPIEHPSVTKLQEA